MIRAKPANNNIIRCIWWLKMSSSPRDPQAKTQGDDEPARRAREVARAKIQIEIAEIDLDG